MKNYLINKVNDKNKWIIYLHGWGQRKESLLNLAINNKEEYNYILIDLPFSKYFKVNKPYKVEDVLFYIKEILDKENIDPSIIIGHSCGGKIALAYALKIKDIPLILCAPSILKPRISIKNKLKIKLYKICKILVKMHVFSHIPKVLKGSNDFQNTDSFLKKTFLKMVNTYYDNEIQNIKSKIVIIVGKEDKEVPINKLKKLDKTNNIEYIEIEGNHFAFNRHFSLIKNKIEELYGNRN